MTLSGVKGRIVGDKDSLPQERRVGTSTTPEKGTGEERGTRERRKDGETTRHRIGASNT